MPEITGFRGVGALRSWGGGAGAVLPWHSIQFTVGFFCFAGDLWHYWKLPDEMG